MIFLNPILGFSQEDFNWENKIPAITPIADSLLIEDAVVISYIEKRKIEPRKSYISTIITLRKKIKILTDQGIQEHSFFRIKQSSNMEIEIVNA